MKKIISKPDYVLQIGFIQRIEGNPFFEEVAKDIYYLGKDDVTIRYLHKEEDPLGSLVIYSSSEEKLSKFEKELLEMIGEKKE